MSRLVGSISKLLGLLKSVQNVEVSRSRVPFQKGQAVTNITLQQLDADVNIGGPSLLPLGAGGETSDVSPLSPS